ncbi:MAG TPA: M28 family peptidase [Gemmatimonadales bacterium]|nr:M28 family peptidase [Gemmatimonadales bacterium]
MSRPLSVALVLALSIAGCAREPAPPPRKFDGPAAFEYLKTQVAFGPRIPRTPAHERMAQWLDSLLRQRADTLIVQSWTHVTAKGDSLPLRNFVARFNPRAQTRILFLAHWDTRPRSDGPNAKNPKAPVPGANDGASGVAVLLGVADVLKRQPPAVGVDLLFDDGEDYGDFNEQPNDVLIGARYFAAHLPPGPLPKYAVLFDLVADRDLQIYQEGNSLTGAPEIVNLVWSVAKKVGHQDVFLDSPKHTLTDDHVELQKVGIKAIDVVDFDYPSWHTPDDTIDKVSAASLQVVGDVALALVRQER